MFTPRIAKQELSLSFRYFDLQSGEELAPTNYVIALATEDKKMPRLAFSQDHSKFVVYNYKAKKESSSLLDFEVFELGKETPLHQYQIEADKLAPPLEYAVHLSPAGDLLVVAADATNFNTQTYFWGAKTEGITQIDNTFFFERPAGRIQAIDIVQQGASSYFVTLAAAIDEELIGFNITGINVVLKSIMFTYNQNFKKEEITAAYEGGVVTSEKQKKKLLEIPESLDNFRLMQSMENDEKDVILIFEELDVMTDFHQNETHSLMPWKFKSKNEKYHYGGDLLLYCFTESGLLKWKKAVQKSQYSLGNSLGLSYIPSMEKNQLRLLVSENSKGGNIYIFDINTIDGTVSSKTNLLPDHSVELVKKYSCWLQSQAVVVCGISPVNASKRTLMLVEF